MTRDLSGLVKSLGLGLVPEFCPIMPLLAGSEDDDINLSSMRQSGLDYSDFVDECQIREFICAYSLYGV